MEELIYGEDHVRTQAFEAMTKENISLLLSQTSLPAESNRDTRVCTNDEISVRL